MIQYDYICQTYMMWGGWIMYQEFAHVYDEFMEVIPYDEWADYIEKI